MYGPMGALERRRAARHRVTFRLVCDDGRGYANAICIDISESGALVQAARNYEVGDTISLVPVGSAGEILFDVPATVVRAIDAPGTQDARRYGLHFEDLTPQRVAGLRKLCAAMPETPQTLPEPEAPSGGPPREGGDPHFRLRTRVGSKRDTPAWAKYRFQ